ncbi:MAG: hypothetical protein QXD21_04415 [Thermoproteota archaeon]
MSPPSDSEVRERLKSIIHEIVLILERWCRYLEQREKDSMILKAFLLGIIVLLPIAFLGILLTSIPIILSSIPLGILSNILFYLTEKRRKPYYLELRDALHNISTGASQNLSEAMLNLLDKATLFLPEIKKRKQYEAILWGILAAIIMFFVVFFSAIVSIALPPMLSSMIVGMLIWLYLKDKAMREYRREVIKFKRLRRGFEEWKKEFVKSL